MASITKVMTAMVVLDAHLPLDEMLTVDISHTPEMKGSTPACASTARLVAAICCCWR
nr:D-alanyl-D-alanine endopeptidase precursor [Klebsiella pneumoniae]